MAKYILLTIFTAFLAFDPANTLAADGITVEGAWARASTGGGRPAAVYMTIRNAGAPDSLVAVASPVAAGAEVHESRMENGVTRMRPAAPLAVPGDGAVDLKPGGYHIMLMGLNRVLEVGGRFPLVLTFEKGGDVEIQVEIMAPGAMGPGNGGDHGHGHGRGREMSR